MEKSRIWQKPKLVILARSTPEESVLTTCKSSKAGTGPHNSNGACYCMSSCSGTS